MFTLIILWAKAAATEQISFLLLHPVACSRGKKGWFV